MLLLEWTDLHLNIISNSSFVLTTQPDLVTWRWTYTGSFTVHSLYLWLGYGGMPNKTYDSVWKANIPLKIKIFLLLLRQDRILTKCNLITKKWQGDISCPFCGLP
jgi:hypothetical protein